MREFSSLKYLLPGSFQSVPGTEDKSDEPTMTREELKEQERLRYCDDHMMMIMMM